MDLTSALLGFGWLFLGALTTLLSYLNTKDERKQGYRQFLYEKQLGVSINVMELAAEVYEGVFFLLIGLSLVVKMK